MGQSERPKCWKPVESGRHVIVNSRVNLSDYTRIAALTFKLKKKIAPIIRELLLAECDKEGV